AILDPHFHFLFCMSFLYFFFFFFFQAEDGIRDYKVTGVQTCALPISVRQRARLAVALASGLLVIGLAGALSAHMAQGNEQLVRRSEERRVGKECRSRWSAYH